MTQLKAEGEKTETDLSNFGNSNFIGHYKAKGIEPKYRSLDDKWVSHRVNP